MCIFISDTQLDTGEEAHREGAFRCVHTRRDREKDASSERQRGERQGKNRRTEKSNKQQGNYSVDTNRHARLHNESRLLRNTIYQVCDRVVVWDLGNVMWPSVWLQYYKTRYYFLRPKVYRKPLAPAWIPCPPRKRFVRQKVRQKMIDRKK